MIQSIMQSMKPVFNIITWICLLAFVVNCGEDGESSVIFGEWTAQSFSYSDCTDSGNEGIQSCSSVSCFDLILNQGSTYSLIRNFTGIPESESGTFEATESSMELCPTIPSNLDCYSFPIELTADQLTVSVPAALGCTATVVLNKQG